MDVFNGHKPISSSTLYPFDYHKDCESVKQRTLEKVRRFRTVRNVKKGLRTFEYTGRTSFGQREFSATNNDNDNVSSIALAGGSGIRSFPSCARYIYISFSNVLRIK